MTAETRPKVDELAEHLMDITFCDGPFEHAVNNGNCDVLVRALCGPAETDLPHGELAKRLKSAIDRAHRNLQHGERWAHGVSDYLGLFPKKNQQRIAKHRRAAAYIVQHTDVKNVKYVRKNRGSGAPLKNRMTAVAREILGFTSTLPRYVDPPANGVCDRSTWESIANNMIGCDSISIVGVAPVPLVRLMQEPAFREQLSGRDRLNKIRYWTPSFDTILRLDSIDDGPLIYTRWAEGLLSFVHALTAASLSPSTNGPRPRNVDVRVFDRRLMSCMIFYFGPEKVLRGVSILVHAPIGDGSHVDGGDFVHAWIDADSRGLGELHKKVLESSSYFDLRVATVRAPESVKKAGLDRKRDLPVLGLKVENDLGPADCIPVASVLVTVDEPEGPSAFLYERSRFSRDRDIGSWAIPSARVQEIDFVAATKKPFEDAGTRVTGGVEADRKIWRHYWTEDANRRKAVSPEALRSAAKRAVMRRCGINIDTPGLELKLYGSYLLKRDDTYDLDFCMYGVALPSRLAEVVSGHTDDSVRLMPLTELTDPKDEDAEMTLNNPLLREGGRWLETVVVPQAVAANRKAS